MRTPPDSVQTNSSDIRERTVLYAEDPHTTPLTGVSVVEAGGDVALRLCGRFLANSGATVRRVPLLHDPVHEQPHGAQWAAFLDRGKSVVDDLDAALGDADLLLTSFGHGHELGAAAVSARYSEVTVASVSPFGETGPYVGIPSDEVVISALAGLTDATPGLPDHAESFDSPPAQSLAQLAETAGGLIGAIAAVGALMPRLLGQPGPAHVEVATLEAASALMVYEWGIASHDGGLRGRRPIPLNPEPNCYLDTIDGTAVLAANSPAHWNLLVQLMGDPDWARDPDFADGNSRSEHWDRLKPRLAAWAAGQRGRDLLVAAQALGLPIACSYELSETLASEQVAVTAATEEEDGRLFPADPIMINGRRSSARRPESRARLGPIVLGASRPLAGVRVLDLGQFVAGPFCGQLLAGLGAQVTLVEPPGLPLSRIFGPFVGEPRHDASAMFNQVNRGKRSIQLDLRSAEGRAAILALVAKSDVVIENFSREAADKLGLTYTELTAVKSDLILGSISGFGRSGPWGDYVALHSGVLLLSGTTSVTRDQHGRMRLAGAVYPDLLAGATTALGVEQALIRRGLTGEGSHVEVAMLDVMLNCMGGLIQSARGGESFPPHPAARFLRARDGDFIAVSALDVDDELAAEVGTMAREPAIARLRAAGLRAVPVQTIAEVMQDPHLLQRGFPIYEVHPVAGRRSVPAVPWIVDGERPQLGPAPCLGAHTEDVLAGDRVDPEGVSA